MTFFKCVIHFYYNTKKSSFRSCLNLYRQVFIEQKLDIYLYFKGA